MVSEVPQSSRCRFRPTADVAAPRFRLPGVVLLLALFGALAPAQLYGEPEELAVAAVQYQVREGRYISEAAFRSSVDALVSDAVAAGAELVIFPEYTGVFLATAPYAAQVRSADTVREALRRIRAADEHAAGTDRAAAADPGRPNLRQLFLEAAPEVSRTMDEIFGGLAARHRVHILAGTYFHRTLGPDGTGSLTNRAVLYDPRGSRTYEQDKVFLTPFEEHLIGLDAGAVAAAHGFAIDGLDVGLTICRDTFFEEWDPVHDDREVWIDIKADGVDYDAAARERYYKTIPERLEATDVPYGITVSLVGSFLELFWEGRTSIVTWEKDRLRTLEDSDSPRRQEIVIETIREP